MYLRNFYVLYLCAKVGTQIPPNFTPLLRYFTKFTIWCLEVNLSKLSENTLFFVFLEVTFTKISLNLLLFGF